MQAGDRCLSDVLAQPVHWGRVKVISFSLQDLQEANLQPRREWGMEAPSLTVSPRVRRVVPLVICGPSTCVLDNPRGF